MQPLPFAVFLVSTMILVAADRKRESINLSKVPPGPYSLAVYARDVMHVSGLHPEVLCGGGMAVALGFREINEEGNDGANSAVGRGPRPIPGVEWTKRRLDHW
ncbi:hypothetical protein ISCGN_008368 [Ixodes scapularis]